MMDDKTRPVTIIIKYKRNYFSQPRFCIVMINVCVQLNKINMYHISSCLEVTDTSMKIDLQSDLFFIQAVQEHMQVKHICSPVYILQ